MPNSKDIERIVDCSGISVYYTDRTNGAGLETREDFVRAIEKIFPNRKFARCYEWCCGPGFFGYSLLGKNLCESLYLADFFQPAVDLALKTATMNHLENKVQVVQSDNWQQIPITEQFDLIVGNPPHFCLQNYYNEIWTYEKRIYIDPEWQIHRDFFSKASRHLAPDGSIVLMECAWGSGLNTFQEMISSAGLKIENHFLGDFKHDKLGFPVYYIQITHR